MVSPPNPCGEATQTWGRAIPGGGRRGAALSRDAFAQFILPSHHNNISLHISIGVCTILNFPRTPLSKLRKELAPTIGGFVQHRMVRLAGVSTFQGGSSNAVHDDCSISATTDPCHPEPSFSGRRTLFIACGKARERLAPRRIIAAHGDTTKYRCPSPCRTRLRMTAVRWGARRLLSVRTSGKPRAVHGPITPR